ncbi:MAG: hypothetical protein AAGF12_10640 [Myxococcota bacterium]
MRSKSILSVVLATLALFGAAGCKVTESDIEYWKGTVKGPGKIKAVLLSDNYDMSLRTKAALALVEMEPRSNPQLDPVGELQDALNDPRVSDETRRQLITDMVDGLERLMAGEETSGNQEEGPQQQQIRAKDAAFVLIGHAEGDAKQRLMRAVVQWYAEDFNGRNLAGNFSAEQVTRSLGAPAAEMLVDALEPELPSPALVKLAELLGDVGTEETRARAGARLVEIEIHMEGDEFLDWLKGKVREQLRAVTAEGQEVDEGRVTSIAVLNRENFINNGALPAMKHMNRVSAVSERLLAVAEVSEANEAITNRRTKALQALEGAATEAMLERLLTLALTPANPDGVRDYAFDRVGDIRSRSALTRLWPLVEKSEDEAQRQRWRAGEMVLFIGGSDIVAEFIRRLPSEDEIKYEPEELEGYATRMSQMTPPPTALMRTQLTSTNWWNRVIGLRFFERQGVESDIPAMERLKTDTAAVNGEAWERLEIENVGGVAEAAIEGLRERLEGGDDEDGEEESSDSEDGE